MLANITITNITPVNGSISIAPDSSFSFDMIPFNGDVIDMATLAITLTIQGDGGNLQLVLNQSSSDVTISDIANAGKHVVIEPMKGSGYTLPSNGSIKMKVVVKNTDGVNARISISSWNSIDKDMLDAAKDLLSELTDIDVENEQGRINAGGSKVDFGWKNWSKEHPVKIYVNSVEAITGFQVDYINGSVTFTTPLKDGNPLDKTAEDWDVVDTVHADYHFDVFTNSEIISFMNSALSQFNAASPTSELVLSNLPKYAAGPAMIGGAYFAINTILTGFANQQSRVKWGEYDYEKAAGLLSSNMSFYKEQFDFFLEQKKKRYPRSYSVAFPQYTLPGGRSRFTAYMFGTGYDM